MKNFAKGLMVPALLTMIACEPMQVNTQKKTKADNVLPKTMNTKKLNQENQQEFVDRMVRMGEILAQSPVGFVHANGVFKSVLSADPGNDKALFYSAFLDIAEGYKGLGTKTKNLWDKPETYEENVRLANEAYYPEIGEFIFKAAGKNYDTYRDAQQDVLTGMQDSYKNALKKLEKIDQDVELIVTVQETKASRVIYDCETVMEDEVEYTSCEQKHEAQSTTLLPSQRTTVDLEDVKVLRGSIKGILNYTRFFSAYSIEGQKELSEEISAKESEFGRSLTDLETHNIVKKYPGYLSLDKNNELSEMRGSLIDMVEIGMDLESLNNQFCGNELREMNLIRTICFDADARKNMEEVLSYLAGPAEMSLGLNKEGGEVKILMDLPAFLNNPVSDLKSILDSLDYNAEGTSNVVREPELNGLFPNGDLLEKLKQVDDSRSSETNEI